MLHGGSLGRGMELAAQVPCLPQARHLLVTAVSGLAAAPHTQRTLPTSFLAATVDLAAAAEQFRPRPLPPLQPDPSVVTVALAVEVDRADLTVPALTRQLAVVAMAVSSSTGDCNEVRTTHQQRGGRDLYPSH